MSQQVQDDDEFLRIVRAAAAPTGAVRDHLRVVGAAGTPDSEGLDLDEELALHEQARAHRCPPPQLDAATEALLRARLAPPPGT
ncbi:MAG TPA: hypothetical protein VGH76_26220 [Actinomycetospora sp.]|jgi:hypothetical protein|uniref:hypothetical protein n=1 Tax=Actinomycetospora sp. TaxID=1872135 RepID=UPI002F3F0E31